MEPLGRAGKPRNTLLSVAIPFTNRDRHPHRRDGGHRMKSAPKRDRNATLTPGTRCTWDGTILPHIGRVKRVSLHIVACVSLPSRCALDREKRCVNRADPSQDRLAGGCDAIRLWLERNCGWKVRRSVRGGFA
jgi:hypothetical protein